jgi:hypothetical protein
MHYFVSLINDESKTISIAAGHKEIVFQKKSAMHHWLENHYSKCLKLKSKTGFKLELKNHFFDLKIFFLVK